MQQFYNLAGLGRELGKEPDVMRYLSGAGKLPGPDIYIGRVVLDESQHPGWSPERVRLAVEYFRSPVAADRPLPDWWHTSPEWYLSISEVAHLLGIQPERVRFLHSRKELDEPPVVVMDREYGWDSRSITTLAAQRGGLAAQAKALLQAA